MGRILIAAVVLLLALGIYRQLQKQPPAQRRALVLRYGFVALVLILVALAATGRMHWLGAAIAAMLPLLKYLLNVAIRLLPFLQQWRRQQPDVNQGGAQHPPAPPNSHMSRSEALQVLGLQENASTEEIIEAHRRLMQKIHPDRGGSDYLAARINQAKNVLLG